MRKKIISGFMIVVVIVLSYFYAHIDKNSYLYDRNADTSSFSGTGVLADGGELSQTFTAREDTIDGINLKVTVSGSVEDVILHYSLLDETSKEVSQATVSGAKLKNNKFNLLTLPEVTETEGKQYTLVLSEENSDEQNGIGFYVNSEDQTLIVRTICHRFDLETFLVLLGMIAFVVGFMKILYGLFQ